MAQGSVEYLNPPELHNNPAFTQVVTASGPVKIVHVGTQNAVDGSGNIVGQNDIAAQTVQTLKNVDACLKAAGAERKHIALWTIYMAAGQSMQEAFGAAQSWLKDMPHAPANNIVIMAGFPNPAFLIGIEVTAFVPEE